MADYKSIHGGTVQNFVADPPAPIAGQYGIIVQTLILNIGLLIQQEVGLLVVV